MISWGFSLIVVASFFGHQANAQDGPRPLKGITSTTAAMATSLEGIVGSTLSTDSTSPGTPSSVDPASSIPTSGVIPSTSSGFGFFQSYWNVPDKFSFNSTQNVYFFAQYPPSEEPPFSPVLFVCQTNAEPGHPMDSLNTWSVAQVTETCEEIINTTCTMSMTMTQTIPVQFLPGTSGASSTGGHFFFCLGNATRYINDLVCDTYSPFFTIESDITNPDLVPRQEHTNLTIVSMMPTTTLSLPNYTPDISLSGEQPVSTPPPSTTSPVTSTVSNPSIGTTTVQASSASPSSSGLGNSILPHNSHNGLSTGAKVGIALGALIFVAALLLLALFFLRRKHRQRSPPPEQVMLTRDIHTDSFSRNALITEKETAIQHTNNISSASPIDDTLPIQRHSAVSPYDSIPAALYNGPASTIPRRKPTAPSVVSRMTGPSSPRSMPRPTSNSSEEFEVYHDTPMPTYGDARHSPRVYTAAEGRAKTPFLGEEGMSAEEVARLEEEERRIDAAIAEAEQQR